MFGKPFFGKSSSARKVSRSFRPSLEQLEGRLLMNAGPTTFDNNDAVIPDSTQDIAPNPALVSQLQPNPTDAPIQTDAWWLPPEVIVSEPVVTTTITTEWFTPAQILAQLPAGASFTCPAECDAMNTQPIQQNPLDTYLPIQSPDTTIAQPDQTNTQQATHPAKVTADSPSPLGSGADNQDKAGGDSSFAPKTEPVDTSRPVQSPDTTIPRPGQTQRTNDPAKTGGDFSSSSGLLSKLADVWNGFFDALTPASDSQKANDKGDPTGKVLPDSTTDAHSTSTPVTQSTENVQECFPGSFVEYDLLTGTKIPLSSSHLTSDQMTGGDAQKRGLTHADPVNLPVTPENLPKDPYLIVTSAHAVAVDPKTDTVYEVYQGADKQGLTIARDDLEKQQPTEFQGKFHKTIHRYTESLDHLLERYKAAGIDKVLVLSKDGLLVVVPENGNN
jgi:hypothetical protein